MPVSVLGPSILTRFLITTVPQVYRVVSDFLVIFSAEACVHAQQGLRDWFCLLFIP